MRTTGMGIHVVPSVVRLAAGLVLSPRWFIVGASMAPASPRFPVTSQLFHINSATFRMKLFPEFGWICVLWALWHVPVLRSFAVQFSCDLEQHSLVGGELDVDVCVVCALYLKLLLYSP
jgi:hypothetical protein